MAAAPIVDALSSWPKDVRPPIGSYTPSMWGDTFTSFSLDDQVQEKYAEAIEVLKDEARNMLMRLGVAYHFEQEIEEQLQEIFKFHSEEDYDLFTAALQFRLLRQHRHYVSCSVFNRFKGKDNKFKETLYSDAKGLLSLYEAVQLRIHGEEILEEALAFTTHHLNRMVQQLESPLQDQVKRALEQSLHKGVPRIETRHYISFYEKDDSKNELLLKLAKLDFNYLQNMYKKDLCQLSRWWNDLNSKLPYARDRVVEAYVWATAFRFEPQYSYARVAVAKGIQMLTIIDDTYDNYATLEEADLFTEILESVYDDYEREAATQGKLFAVSYAKESVKQICRAYNKGFKWFMGEQMPTFEDYLANSVFTGCIYVLCSGTIPGMKSVTEETIDWLMSEPKIIEASTKVCRYLNDLGGYERESKQGQILTGLDFYMNSMVYHCKRLRISLLN
ncbi:hypothetical protein Pfo_006623 [Paulownia fortunei]|nr:hypothetical protein Pfo_006623 [Paulownia fortunei]